MKLYCEECDGKGKKFFGDGYVTWTEECDICKGNGYTEDDKIEEDARLGRAVKIAYSRGAFLIYDINEGFDCVIDSYNCDNTVEEILEWENK